MKVLITGRNGSLTSSLLLFFNQNKYKVFTTSRKKISKKNNYILDLTKKINIKNNFDLVIHCASNHPYTVSTKSKKVLLEENLKMSKNIHEFLIKKKIPKLVFISSVGVYGKVYSKILSENYK